MFYSHTYLRRNGRFGLIWLAATQSKVLNKRELYAINVSIACSDILDHIPGNISKDVLQRPRRFSLYLTSQLMYGSAKVLQKQWDYLFVDVNMLIRKFHPEISSDIDLVLRQDPVTIASCVPTNKEYDPFFGMNKDSTVDVEAILDIWDSNYVSRHMLSPSAQPDIESPATSVADKMDIQIRDTHVMPIEQMLPGEQDLPLLDFDNMALLDQSGDVVLSAEELCSPQVSRILAATDPTKIQDLSYIRCPLLEETPAVRTSGDIPRTPEKQKRKRRNDIPDERRAKHKVIEHGEGLTGIPSEEHRMATPHVESGLQAGPLLLRGHDWMQQQPPPIELSPVIPFSSPVRRRRSRKLIVDQTIQMSRDDMKANMLTSDSTSQPLNLPKTKEIDWLKEPGNKNLRNPTLAKLWTRNCKFGLRIYDTETESSTSTGSPISPVLPVPIRESSRRQTDTMKTPIDRSISVPLSLSVEHKRDDTARSASFVSDKSRSLIAHVTDESQGASSAKKRRGSSDSELSGHEGLSILELEKTGERGTLQTWPEEQEHMISPPRHPQESDLAIVVESDDMPYRSERQTSEEGDTPRTHILKMVTKSVRTVDDWTTFRTICPPSSFDRVQAARLFMALCNQLEEANLCVRQDDPFTDIFIWLPAGRSE